MPSLVRQTLKWSAVTADRVRRPPRGVVILIFHRVGARTRLDVDMPVAQFEAQIQELAATGRVRRLDEALDALALDTPPAADPIVVTFDDGTADFADLALPILARYSVPATLYVATQFVDEGREFPAEGKPLSWAALRDVHASGIVTVGSHTHSHALLDRVAPDVITAELDRADARQ